MSEFNIWLTNDEETLIDSVKYAISYRMRILKELYDKAIEDNGIYDSLTISNDTYTRNKLHIEHLGNKGLIHVKRDKCDNCYIFITDKGIEALEQYLLDNEDYIMSGYSAFSNRISILKIVSIEQTMKDIEEVKKKLEKY